MSLRERIREKATYRLATKYGGDWLELDDGGGDNRGVLLRDVEALLDEAEAKFTPIEDLKKMKRDVVDLFKLDAEIEGVPVAADVQFILHYFLKYLGQEIEAREEVFGRPKE